jgi:hypothetical protein
MLENVCISKDFDESSMVILRETVSNFCSSCEFNSSDYETCSNVKRVARKLSGNFELRLHKTVENAKNESESLTLSEKKIENTQRELEAHMKSAKKKAEDKSVDKLENIHQKLNTIKQDEIEKIKDEIDNLNVNELPKLKEKLHELKISQERNVDSWRSFAIKTTLAFVTALTLIVLAFLVVKKIKLNKEQKWKTSERQSTFYH